MTGAVEITQIDVDGVRYTNTRPNYYYKKVDGKQVRISKAEWEQAFEQYIQTADDNAETDAEIEEVEATPVKKEKKSRRSKDIEFETTVTLADDKIADVTLTSKQVAFIERMPEDDFYEHGLESALWIDVYCDTVADQFSPMAVGAMVSTLREKNIIYVVSDKINGKKAKWMAFTELGKQVAKELGLK